MRCGRPNLLRFPPDTIRDLVVEGYEDGNFLAPTVLTGDAGPGIPAYDEEVFGPVLCCVTVETLEEAIQLVNSCTYGNGAYCLSNAGFGRSTTNAVERLC